MNDPCVPTVCYNRKWVYKASLAAGTPAVDAFEIIEEKFDSVRLPVGEAILKTEYIFVDPFMESTEVGTVQPACAICRVIHVNDPSGRLRPNDWVEAAVGWQLYAVVRIHTVCPIQTTTGDITPDLLTFVGVPGRAAYYGFLEAGKPERGSTVVVSGAGGAVGYLTAQIALIKECRVVGIAQNASQCEYLRERLGIATVNAGDNTTVSQIRSDLQRHCPDGVDIYVDNMGGVTTEAVLQSMNIGGRVVVTAQPPRVGTPCTALQHALFKRLVITGVSPLDYRDREEEFMDAMRKWVADRLVRAEPTVVDGMENLPEVFASLLDGKYTGTPVVVRADYNRRVVEKSPCVPRSNSPRRLHVTRDD